MFEKDAEEIVKRNVCEDCNRCQSHGYIGCDIYRYSKDSCLRGLRGGYNKANEWHYVKDGDFPKDETEKEYLVALKSEYSGFHYEIDIWCKSLHCFASNNPIKVYAWKEIVLPKESE